jgi:hypothetical protein
LATTQISLIREHTEKIKPPRALWVPFELGRPLGVPNDAAWQTRVLQSALELIEAPKGPVLVDFPDDAPVSDEPAVLACPVSFPAPVTDLNDMEQLNTTLQREVSELRSWYNMAVTKNGRTTVGVSGLEPEAIGKFLGAFLGDKIPASPRDDMPSFTLLKLVIEDLKAYYYEAMAAQPGHAAATGKMLADWLWRETTAGKVFFWLHENWRESEDSTKRLFSRILLVPASYLADSPYRNIPV